MNWLLEGGSLEDRVLLAAFPFTNVFEITDANVANSAAVDNTPGTGTPTSPAKTPLPDDWANIYKSVITPGPAGQFDNAFARAFVNDPPATDISYFTGGGSKDVNDINQWLHSPGDVAPDKNDIVNAFAAAYTITPAQDTGTSHFVIYFGADKFDASGSNQIGFWFFGQNITPINPTGSGGFSGVHNKGDLLVLTDFTGGGSTATVKVLKWVGGKDGDSKSTTVPVAGKGDGPLQLLNTSVSNTAAFVNISTTQTSPWPYTDKNGAHNFAPNTFFEGAIDISAIPGLGTGCFSSFLAESRSSGSSTTAQLKDFALGQLNACAISGQGGTDVSKATDTANYTITIQNNGAQTLYLKDVIDDTGGNRTLGNIVLNGVVQTAPVGETFSVPAGALDGLAPGETQTITVTRVTQSGDPDPITTKTKVVLNSQPGPGFGGDSITLSGVTNTVDLFAPAVEITKAADVTAAKVGDVITYTYTITNKTDGNLNTVALDGTAPALVLDTISDNKVGNLLTAANAAGCGTLALNASCNFTATYTVLSGDFVGPLENTVTVHYHPSGFPNDITDDDSESVDLVDAGIGLSPLTATNEVNATHTVTATVTQVVNGIPTAALDGTVVSFSLLNNTAGADFVDDGVDSDGDLINGNDCVTSGGTGTCFVQITTSTAGSVDIHATTTFDVGGVSLTRETDGTGSNSGDANKVFVDAGIGLSPLTATNEVNATHTVTATVTQDLGDGNGLVAAPDGTVVSFSLLNNTAGADFVDDLVDSDGDLINGNDCVTSGGTGTCFIQITTSTAGSVDIHATTTFEVDTTGVFVTRETDGTGNNSGDANKVFVDAGIGLSPLTATNEVNATHTVTATVTQDLGDGNGLVAAPDGTVVSFSLLNNTAGADFVDDLVDSDGDLINGNDCVTSGGTGTCFIQITTSTAGSVDIHATTTFEVDTTGVFVTRETDGTGNNSEDANKVFVDAGIGLSPLEAENQVTETHIITATVTQDLGDGNGLVAAPDGTVVSFSLTNDTTATADFIDVDPLNPDTVDSDGDGNPLDDCVTAGGTGTCQVAITSNTPGTVTIHATTTFDVGGVSLTRETDGLGNNSDDATKVFLGFPDLHIVKSAETSEGDPITDPIPQGDQFQYVLLVTNDGNAPAHTVTVNDDLDDRLSIVSVTVNGSPASYIADPSDPTDPNHIIISVGDLARSGQPNDEATIVIVVDTGEPGQDCLYTTNFATVATVDQETPASLHSNGLPGESDNTSDTVVVVTTETFQTILFDPDGIPDFLPDGVTPNPANTVNTVEVESFDQSPGNALAVGAVPGVATSAGVDFRLIFQATLSALFGPGSSHLSIPGLGTTFDILTEANFMEHGASPASGFVLFSDPTSASGPNSFQLIYHPIGTAINNRTGAGFAFDPLNGDQVIATAHITSIFGSVATNGTTSPRLDPTNGAPPAGPSNPLTVNFAGSTRLGVAIDYANPAFFPDATRQLTELRMLTLNSAPFDTVGANTGPFFEGTTRSIGPVNGSSGPDVQLQSDASTSLTCVCVPLNEDGTPHPTTGEPLLAASVGSGAGVASLTEQQLQPVVNEAIARWAATGLDPVGMYVLNHVAVHITDLSGAKLGLATPGGIWISQDAAGRGWSTNASANPAPGTFDLLSVIEHEMGHVLGYDHADAGLMEPSLEPGLRLNPEGHSAAQSTVLNLGVPALNNLIVTPTRSADLLKEDAIITGSASVLTSQPVTSLGQAAPRLDGSIALVTAVLTPPSTSPSASSAAAPGAAVATGTAATPSDLPTSTMLFQIPSVPFGGAAGATSQAIVALPGFSALLPPSQAVELRLESGVVRGDNPVLPKGVGSDEPQDWIDRLPRPTRALRGIRAASPARTEEEAQALAASARMAGDAYLAEEDLTGWLASERKATAPAEEEAESVKLSLDPIAAVAGLALAVGGYWGGVVKRRPGASRRPLRMFRRK